MYDTARVGRNPSYTAKCTVFFEDCMMECIVLSPRLRCLSYVPCENEKQLLLNPRHSHLPLSSTHSTPFPPYAKLRKGKKSSNHITRDPAHTINPPRRLKKPDPAAPDETPSQASAPHSRQAARSSSSLPCRHSQTAGSRPRAPRCCGWATAAALRAPSVWFGCSRMAGCRSGRGGGSAGCCLSARARG